MVWQSWAAHIYSCSGGSIELEKLGQEHRLIAVALASGCTFPCADKSFSSPYPTPVITPRTALGHPGSQADAPGKMCLSPSCTRA